MGQKCIPIRKKLIHYMAEQFPDFLFEGSHSDFYAFRRQNADGIYDHIVIQREFYEGILSMVITEIACCYNKSYRGLPWFAVGYETDIAVLITGKHCYSIDVGWHRIENDAKQLNILFEGIKKDIDNYVLDYIEKCHKKINADRYMTTMNRYMQAQLKILSEEEIDTIKQYLIDSSKAYSEYRKECRKMCKKNGLKEAEVCFNDIPMPSTVKKWIEEIKNALGYSYLSERRRSLIINDTTVLFRDNFNFYTLIK